MIERPGIEPGILALVEAANSSGYETYSSCEGHPDSRAAAVGFFANEEQALKLHKHLVRIREELLCNWELIARFIWRDGWVLGWKLENFGIKNDVYENETEYWLKNTEAGKTDAVRLARLFASLDEG
jgi:hypothetical protein